jgi:hypothetical protein
MISKLPGIKKPGFVIPGTFAVEPIHYRPMQYHYRFDAVKRSWILSCNIDCTFNIGV